MVRVVTFLTHEKSIELELEEWCFLTSSFISRCFFNAQLNYTVSKIPWKSEVCVSLCKAGGLIKGREERTDWSGWCTAFAQKILACVAHSKAMASAFLIVKLRPRGLMQPFCLALRLPPGHTTSACTLSVSAQLVHSLELG